jgi:hypothetical protein
LQIPLEGFRISCPARILVPPGRHELRFSNQIFAGALGIHKTAVAELDAKAAVELSSAAENLHDRLTVALRELTDRKHADCSLSNHEISEGEIAAYVAAAHLQPYALAQAWEHDAQAR